MKKQNILMLIVIFIVALLIAFLGGYWLSGVLTENRDNENISDSKNETNTDKGNEELSEVAFDIKEAQKLMDKYIISSGCGLKYIYDLSNELHKNEIAITNTEKSKDYTCKKVYGEGIFIIPNSAHACIDEGADEYITFTSSFYKYNKVLESKKQLFGEDVTLGKTYFKDESGYMLYDYVENFDIYVETLLQGGYDAACSIKNQIESAYILGNSLKINVSEQLINHGDDNLDTVSTNKREYTFKLNGKDYYMIGINEIK